MIIKFLNFIKDYGQKPKYIEDIEKTLEESRKGFKEFLVAERHLTKPVKMDEETKEKIFEVRKKYNYYQYSYYT